ncbi:hypothetical protein [uncultured Nostoc sp.]|uniref:hypothetical protein n=1 Tax=uncultured Nostoc sp. TaxID=340711 RepID=UPI0035C9E23A
MERTDWIKLHLPSWKHLGRFLLWGSGRVLISAWLFTLYGTIVLCKTVIHLAELTKQATLHLVKIYDQLPYMGVPLQNVIDVASVVVEEPQQIVTDLLGAIEGKQLMIIGEMGTGKSTIAQYLAYSVGGRVKVYECEGTPDDWAGLEVIGKGENWGAIEAGMQADLEDLSNQMQIRNEKGDNALVGTERVIICEEYPELVSKVDSSTEWLERHARRGRKARRFAILLSQYDRVAAWGLEGKSDLADAFYRLRLGKKAVAHAKSLKNDDLMTWLQSDRSHCLLDDQPCKLPSFHDMKAVTQRLQLPAGNATPVTAESLSGGGFEAIIIDENAPSPATIRAVKACLEAGFSDTKIIKEILGYQGNQFGRGKKVLEEIRK